MVPAAHTDAIPGKSSDPSPLTHLKDRYYHEVAAMPKIIGGRETGIWAEAKSTDTVGVAGNLPGKMA
jgi:hypothetical protein